MKNPKYSMLIIGLCCIFYMQALADNNTDNKGFYSTDIPEWLKRINIYSGEAPQDILETSHTTVIAWGSSAALDEDKSGFTDRINSTHNMGLKYVAGFSPITATGRVFEKKPELVDAACLNIDGEKMQLDWYPIGPSEPFWWGCTNHPVWQNYLKEVIQRNIDCGADGIHIDEIYGTQHAIWRGGCFCTFCMSGFRDFLKSNFSSSELQNRFGITSIDNFDYQQYLIDNNHTDTWNSDQQWSVPLYNEYQTYQKEAVQSVMRNLISETKQYALDNYGREISYSANINDLNPDGLKFAEDLDIFILEYFYKEVGYPPKGKAATVLKLAHSLDNKSGILMTAINTNADLLKYQKTSNLMKIYIAEAYSVLGSFLVPYNIYAFDESTGTSPGSYTADIQEISPYYEFIINHPMFYEDLISLAAAGLIYTYSNNAGSELNSFHGAGYLLSDLNIQYDVIFAGDSHFLNRPLESDKITKYGVIILPGNQYLLQDDFDVLSGYMNGGGEIIGMGDLQIVDTNGNNINNTTLESFKTEGYHLYGQGGFYYIQKDLGQKYLNNKLSDDAAVFSSVLDSLLTNKGVHADYSQTCNVFAYQNPNTSDIFIHLVNYNHDINMDNVIPADSIKIVLSVENISSYSSSFLVSPDFSDLTPVQIDTADGTASLTVPGLDIYSIVYLSQRTPAGEVSIISADPSLDTTIIAGETLNLSVEIQNESEFPVYYYWYVNNQFDSTVHGNSYSFYRDRNCEGADTVLVIVDNGFQEVKHTWIITVMKYNYPKILFDEAHEERNTIDYSRAQQINYEHPGWNYFGILKTKIEEDFIIERHTEGELNASVLQNYNAVIISAPEVGFSASEISSIVTFISQGGGLCFMGDVGINNQSINDLIQYFGIKFDYNVIFEPYLQGQDGGNPKVKSFIDHASLISDPSFEMNWGGSFNISSPAVAIGFSDSATWQDVNSNKIEDLGESKGPFTIICAAEYDQGRVFCISDNSLHDDYVKNDICPNDELLLYALHWLTENVNKPDTYIERKVDISESFKLSQNYPNPFNPVTNIEFQVPRSSRVVIKVFNMLGQEVKSLVDKHFESGSHTVSWNGQDNYGKQVCSGVYIYCMWAEGFIEFRKGLIIR